MNLLRDIALQSPDITAGFIAQDAHPVLYFVLEGSTDEDVLLHAQDGAAVGGHLAVTLKVVAGGDDIGRGVEIGKRLS